VSGSLKPLDWVLIVTLCGSWLVTATWSAWDGFTYGRLHMGVGISSAAAPGDYPTITSVWRKMRWKPRPRPGDQLTELDGRSLAGARAVTVGDRVLLGAREHGHARVRLRRSVETWTAELYMSEVPAWWAIFPFSVAIIGTALLLLLRAPHWHLARRYFVACWIFAVMVLLPQLNGAGFVWQAILVLILFPLGVGLTGWNAQDFIRLDRPVPLWQRGAAIFAACLMAAYLVNAYFLPHELRTSIALSIGSAVVFGAVTLGGLTRSYLHAQVLERRQVRWVVLGFYLAFLGTVMIPVARALDLGNAGAIQVVNAVLLLGVPSGIMVSVIGYQFLDVDRLISATASYSIVGAVVVLAAVAALPAIAGTAADGLGVEPATAQTLLTVALIGAAIPAHRYLRPRLDRRMFAERHARALGFEELIEHLGRCTSVGELTELCGERLDGLLQPESIAIYARDEATSFVPVFARGRAVPPAFEADSLLVQTLEKRVRPLASDAAELGPFERAALETLAVSVVIPTRRTEDVVAFTCLGDKRSGDIYTPEELAYMAAVATRCSEVLLKLDDEVVIREARQLQQALRRYVPGAVADEITSGRDLEAGEREISVLFVDIRGYSSFAEPREAEEIFSTVNAYTEQVSRIVGERGGVVVEFNGDGMMAVFGAPRPLDDKERAAVECARDLARSLPDEIAVGVGIATGSAFVGSIRAADRMIWSAIGNTTNLAARLQSLTRDLDAAIAIDDVTHETAGYVCADFDAHPALTIRGRSDRQDVWTLPLARSR